MRAQQMQAEVAKRPKPLRHQRRRRARWRLTQRIRRSAPPPTSAVMLPAAIRWRTRLRSQSLRLPPAAWPQVGRAAASPTFPPLVRPPLSTSGARARALQQTCFKLAHALASPLPLEASAYAIKVLRCDHHFKQVAGSKGMPHMLPYGMLALCSRPTFRSPRTRTWLRWHTHTRHGGGDLRARRAQRTGRLGSAVEPSSALPRQGGCPEGPAARHVVALVDPLCSPYLALLFLLPP